MVEESPVARYTGEFIGTYLLIVTIGCNVLGGAPAAWAATSIACVLMVSIYALGGVSGANFNPAVSFALGLSGKLPWLEVVIYCVVQLIAGACAAFTYLAVYGRAFDLGPSKGFTWYEVLLAESLYTFMLCFVVLNVAAASKNEGNQFYGLAIGFVIVAGGYGAGAISGGCFNPAVAFSIECATFKFGLNWGFIYMAAELLGAAIASLLFRLVRPDEFGWSPDYGLGSKCISEFIGTFFLVLTVGLNVLANSAAPVWSIAASLMSMIYALGSCSGAHFNPAVTVAICMSGRDKCRWIDGAAYIFVQICSGILAGYTYSGMHQGKTFSLVYGPDYGWVSAGLAEVIFTFVLCFVVLSVATTQESIKETFGFAIGSCVTVGGYAVGAVSGGSLNPAVSFGIAMSDAVNGGPWWNCLFYSGFELVGAVLATGAFWLTRPSEYVKEAGSDRIWRY